VWDRQLYPGMSLFADFDNDGWLDLLVTVRNDGLQGKAKNLLFMNKGDGTFEPIPIALSGIDDMSLGAQAVDLDGDGLLDLFFMARRSGTGASVPTSEFMNKVLRNTGHWRGSDAHANHFVDVRLAGLPAEKLLGAKLLAYDDTNRLLGRQDYFVDVFRGSHDPTVHFGLGKTRSVHVKVVLPDQSVHAFVLAGVDKTLTLDVSQN
jgi:hypothetical protein